MYWYIASVQKIIFKIFKKLGTGYELPHFLFSGQKHIIGYMLVQNHLNIVVEGSLELVWQCAYNEKELQKCQNLGCGTELPNLMIYSQKHIIRYILDENHFCMVVEGSLEAPY